MLLVKWIIKDNKDINKDISEMSSFIVLMIMQQKPVKQSWPDCSIILSTYLALSSG